MILKLKFSYPKLIMKLGTPEQPPNFYYMSSTKNKLFMSFSPGKRQSESRGGKESFRKLPIFT